MIEKRKFSTSLFYVEFVGDIENQWNKNNLPGRIELHIKVYRKCIFVLLAFGYEKKN